MFHRWSSNLKNGVTEIVGQRFCTLYCLSAPEQESKQARAAHWSVAWELHCTFMKLKSASKWNLIVYVSVAHRRRQREGCRAAGGGRMECSWKTVLLLVCASLGVQYTAIRTLRDSLSGPCQGAYRCQTRHHRGTPWQPVKVVPHTVLPHQKGALCLYSCWSVWIYADIKFKNNINN